MKSKKYGFYTPGFTITQIIIFSLVFGIILTYFKTISAKERILQVYNSIIEIKNNKKELPQFLTATIKNSDNTITVYYSLDQDKDNYIINNGNIPNICFFDETTIGNNINLKCSGNNILIPKN